MWLMARYLHRSGKHRLCGKDLPECFKVEIHAKSFAVSEEVLINIRGKSGA